MNYVIVGGWAAGIAAAQQLRRLEPLSTVTIVDTEPVPYYARPDLIDYIAGRKTKDLLPMHDTHWYMQNGFALLSGQTVTTIDVSGHRCILNDGSDLKYDRLLLSAGASPFIPPLPGVTQSRVLALRTLADADKLLAWIAPGANAVVVGGGVLGLEAARAITERGMTASVIEYAPHLLPHQLDDFSAAMLDERLQSFGITTLLNAESQEVLTGDRGATGILLKNGRSVRGDFVLFSTGVRPNIAIARDAGLAVGKGVQVDDTMQTSAPDIYAAGDIAEHRGRVYGIIPPCLEQAKIAAQNMVKPGSAQYAGSIMSNSLKVVGLEVLSMGNINPGINLNADEIVAHNHESYRKVVLEAGIITGLILYGTTVGARPLQQALRAHADLSLFKNELTHIDWDFASM